MPPADREIICQTKTVRCQTTRTRSNPQAQCPGLLRQRRTLGGKCVHGVVCARLGQDTTGKLGVKKKSTAPLQVLLWICTGQVQIRVTLDLIIENQELWFRQIT